MISVVLGAIGALGTQVFLYCLELAQSWFLTGIGDYREIGIAQAHALSELPPAFQHRYWLIPLSTTIGGLLAGILIYGLAPETEGHGTDGAINAFHLHKGRVRARVPFVKTIVSALTIGSGGSGGREGPTAQIASGFGAIIGAWLKLSDDERRLVLLAGMAAGLSAVFKSPLGTAIFAVEILYSTMALQAAALLYCMVAAAVAFVVIGLFQGFTPLFLLPPTGDMIAPIELLGFAALGVIAGCYGRLLPAVYYFIRDRFRALPVPNHVKPAIGGFFVGCIGVFVPQIIGGGYGYAQFMLQGAAGMSVGLLLLLAFGKMITTSLTIGSGGSGGMFGPTLYMGAALGAAFAALLHGLGLDVNLSWYAVVGMAAVFAGAARVPLASMVMVIEMTGDFQLIAPAIVAVALAFIVQSALSRHVRYPTLYEAQLPTPSDSPVQWQSDYDSVARLLLRHQLVPDDDLLRTELADALLRPQGLQIGSSDRRAFLVRLKPGTPLAGRALGTLELADTVVVAVIRDGNTLPADASTSLRVGDGLLLTTTEAGIRQLRAAAVA